MNYSSYRFKKLPALTPEAITGAMKAHGGNPAAIRVNVKSIALVNEWLQARGLTIPVTINGGTMVNEIELGVMS